MKKKLKVVVVVLSILILFSGCAAFTQWGQRISQSLKGVRATYKTFNASGEKIDEIEGTSFKITRDDRFDSFDSEGNSNEDSSVLKISVGDSHIYHVGSTMILEQEGLTDVIDTLDTQLYLENLEPGIPFLNNIKENFQNFWNGKSKTLMIRSQQGYPVAVYTGNSVEIFATDVPKSTWFQIDGKMLFVYRADYTLIDSDLLN